MADKLDIETIAAAVAAALIAVRDVERQLDAEAMDTIDRRVRRRLFWRSSVIHPMASSARIMHDIDDAVGHALLRYVIRRSKGDSRADAARRGVRSACRRAFRLASDMAQGYSAAMVAAAERRDADHAEYVESLSEQV